MGRGGWGGGCGGWGLPSAGPVIIELQGARRGGRDMDLKKKN